MPWFPRPCSRRLLRPYCPGEQVMIPQWRRPLICRCKVLQKFDTHSSASTVYLTDYTAIPLAYPLTSSWCPPELFSRILRCEMWDDAKMAAKEMNPGEYWYLDNVRAKWNPAHYMEATMQLQQRTIRLDETASQDWPHLKALLASVS